jgi:ABC-2 type transport system permease protein
VSAQKGVSAQSEPAARINDRGYRRYEGTRGGAGSRWWVVARRLLRGAVKQRAVIAIAVIAAFPTVVCALLLYFRNLVDPSNLVYRLFFDGWGTFILALAMALRVGGGAIADDARAGGFQFYFARPLTHAQYLAGKLVGVAALLAAITALPAMALSLVRLALSQGGTDATRALGLVLKSAALGGLESLVLASVVVALSSLMKRRGLVQGAFAALIFLPWLAGNRFREFTRTPWPSLASIPTHLDALGRWLYGVPNELGDRAMPPAIALVALLAIAAASVAVAWRQLRRAEVVAG